MSESRIKKLDLLADTKFLKLYNAEYLNKKGEKRQWTLSSRKNYDTLKDEYFEGKEGKSDAVVIAALHEESKKLVIIKEFRVPLNDYIYELPAGLIDGNESIETASVRELKEETGLDAVKINLENTKDRLYASPGMTDESAALVFLRCSGELSKEYLEDDEDIEVLLVSKEEAEKLIKTDSKMDIKAYVVMKAFISLGELLF